MIDKRALEGRLDPYYYQPEFLKLRNKFKMNNFVYLKDLIKNWERGDGPREGFYTEDSLNGIYFLRVNNLKNNSIDLADVKFINKNIHDKTLKRSQVKSGDIVFAISGTKKNLGTVSIIPDFIKAANLNSALVKIEFDTTQILKKYFCYLFELNVIRIQIEYIGKGAVQNNLNNEEINQIQIPLPPLPVQQQIVQLFEAAYQAKQQKEAQAKALLAGIDAYLLQMLGIQLPAPQAPQTVFFTPFSKTAGGRLDPFYYMPAFQLLEIALVAGKYPIVLLKSVLIDIQTGQGIYETENTGINYLNVNNIKRYKIDNSDVLKTMCTGVYVVKNNILTGRVGTLGNFALYENDIPALISDNIFRLTPDSGTIIVKYLLFILNSSILTKQIVHNSKGAVQGVINTQTIKYLKIPLPPLDVQNQIADAINAMRMQAAQLEAEAEEGIAKARAEIERLILGDDV